MPLIQEQLRGNLQQAPVREYQRASRTTDVLHRVPFEIVANDDPDQEQEPDLDEEMLLATDDSESRDPLSEENDIVDDIDSKNISIVQERNDVDDAAQMYLRELGRVPLLTAEQEIYLGQRIERAKKEQARAQTLALTPDSNIITDGNEAQRHLIEANLRLVVSIARKYAGHGMSLLDLIQEGNTGLIQAAEKFDYKKGVRFATYATWHIRHAVTRALANQARMIRLPVYVIEHLHQMNAASRSLVQTLGREPSPEEIARQMQISPEKLNEFRHVMQEPLSLEMPVGEEGDTAMADLVEDQSLVSPAEAIDQQVLKEEIAFLLQNLNERERAVIQLRFGFLDGNNHTLEEAGQALHVTRERARQIEVKALKKLRDADHSNQLRDFLH